MAIFEIRVVRHRWREPAVALGERIDTAGQKEAAPRTARRRGKAHLGVCRHMRQLRELPRISALRFAFPTVA
jgi:hypothetical protein